MNKEILLRQELWKAEMTIKSFERASGGKLNYDEAVSLAKMSEQTKKDCGPFDPAFEFFCHQSFQMWKLAEAINIKEELNRKDHLKEVKVIASHSAGSVMEETALWVPVHVSQSKLDMELQATQAYQRKMIMDGLPQSCFKDLEVVLV